MPIVKLNLLGEFQLLLDRKSAPVPSKGKELLAFLTINSARATDRERISGILWPDFPHERALANLATTVWRVRLAVGKAASDLLLASGRGIILNRAILRVDLWDFEECVSRISNGSVDRASAARAISLYRGNILETSDADWLAVPRERTRQLYVRALQIWADHASKNGEISEAIGAYELALEADPFNEGICRAVMRAYVARGERAKGLQVFVALQRRLHEELKLDPEPETKELFELIRKIRIEESTGTAAWAHEFVAAKGDQQRIVGRQSELDELDSLLSRALARSSQWIGVEGEIGIGKTRLVQEICRSALLKGFKVVYRRCAELPRPSAYSILKEVLADFPGLWTEIEALVGQRTPEKSVQTLLSMGRSTDSALRVRCSEVIASRLRTEALRAPIIIVLEDIQFSDHASLELILGLQDATRGERVIVVLTWRGGECPEPLSYLARSRHELRRVIKLPRLDRSSVRMICEDHIGSYSPPKHVVDFVYEQSEGNPLFAIECLRTIKVRAPYQTKLWRGTLHWQSPEAVNGEGQIIRGIRAYVVGRLRMLSKEATRLLTTAAACGREIEPQFIARVMRLPLARVLYLLANLVEAGFVGQLSDRFEFVHDKIRQLCYEQVPVSRWIKLHGRINDILEADFPDRLEALAFHSGRAGLTHKSAMHWERIGERALSLWAHADAEKAFSMALQQLERCGLGKLGDKKFELLRKRLLAYEHVGELEHGMRDITNLLELANALGDKRRTCEALTLESRFLLRQGAFSRSLERAGVSIRMSCDLGLSGLEAEAREIAALAMYRLGDYEQAELELNKLRKVSEETNDAHGLERVWNNLGRVQVIQGRYLEALDSLERAERLGTGDLHHRAMRTLFRGIAHGFLGKGDEAILDLQLAARDFARVGNASGNAITNAYLASFNISKGEIVSGILCARKGLPFKAGRTEARWAWNSASVLSFSVWLVLGNFRRARNEITRFLDVGPALGNTGIFLDTAAAIALEEGQFEAALELAEEAVGRLASERSSSADALVTLGRCYLAKGQPKKALDVLSRAASTYEKSSERLNLPRTWSFLAVAERELGLTDDALAHSWKAVELLSESRDFAYIPQDVYWNHFVNLRAVGDSAALGVLIKAYRLVMRQASQLGKVGRSRFLAVTVNRDILEAWDKAIGSGNPMRHPRELGSFNREGLRLVTTLIPIAGAPLGRRLRADDFVEVIWTVEAGRRDRVLAELKGDVGLRQARILRLCAEANVQGGDPREDDLARVLGVTTRTIRSDIAYLRSKGCQVQTRGTNLH